MNSFKDNTEDCHLEVLARFYSIRLNVLTV